ncbi:MAG TPA: NTP transferase domain-containing protein, partial [Thermoanaerobaculia bacterium]|nr:NTP transferase domain-containing protein [Thermoanaerobaculia bacterium]
FFDRAVVAARAAFDRVIAVQRPGGERLPIETIEEEPHDDAAAMFGLLAALRHARATCFVLAVDYPLIDANVLHFLRARVARSKSSIVVPRWSGKLQMLCAGYAWDVEPLVAERIAERRYDLRGLARGAEIIEEDELRSRFGGEPLLNVNTPEELESAMRYA